MDKYLIIKERNTKVLAQIANSGLAGQVFPEISKIRIQQPLQSGKGQYVFNIKDPNVDNISTFSLDRNDVFIPNNWGVRIVFVNKTTGAMYPYTFAPKNDGTNPSVFPVGFTTDDIEALFAGNVQWILDNNVAMSAYPMEKFHKVPETQGLFVLDGDGNAVQEGIQLERNLDKDLELLINKYQICGTRDHRITVSFDAANKTFALNNEGYEARLELMMEGFLIKGGCEQPTVGKNPFGQAAGNW